jgi:hypothetical protein
MFQQLTVRHAHYSVRLRDDIDSLPLTRMFLPPSASTSKAFNVLDVVLKRPICDRYRV